MLLLKVFSDKTTLGKAAADQAARAIRNAIATHGEARIIAATVKAMSAFVALLKASVQRLARMVPAVMSVNVLGMSRGATANG